MTKPLWALAGIALLSTAGITGAVIVASSGGEEEVVQQAETATPGASATPAGSASATQAVATPTPSATSAAPSTALPDGWQLYVDPELGFSLVHPPGTTALVNVSDLPEAQGHPAVGTRTLTFSNGEGVPAISLFIASNPDSLSLEDWLTVYPGCCFGKAEPLTIAGEPALRFPEDPLDHNPTVLFRHGGFIFGLRGFVTSVPQSPEAPILSEADFQRTIADFRHAS